MQDRKLKFIGLDFETTGTSHEHSAPIEIGLASESGQSFGSLIGGWRWHLADGTPTYGQNTYIWDEEAGEIHGITPDELNDAPWPKAVDESASEWVRDVVGGEPKGIIAVGWNVAAFDFPFLRRYLPKTAASMSYRSVDLNALVFGITQAGLTQPYTNEPWGYYGLKSFVKEQAAVGVEQQTGWAPDNWHNAEYDALASVYAYFELLEVLKHSGGQAWL